MIHDQGAGDEETAAYIQRYGLRNEEEARKSLSFIKHPLYRSYIFTYRYGGELVDGLFAARGDRDVWFTRLLAEPVTPGQVRGWSEAWSVKRDT